LKQIKLNGKLNEHTISQSGKKPIIEKKKLQEICKKRQALHSTSLAQVHTIIVKKSQNTRGIYHV
jgi:hypothetical protein